MFSYEDELKFPNPYILKFPLVFESVAHDPLHNPVLARVREAMADAEVELPIRRDIEIDGREEDVMLVGQPIEVFDRSRF